MNLTKKATIFCCTLALSTSFTFAAYAAPLANITAGTTKTKSNPTESKKTDAATATPVKVTTISKKVVLPATTLWTEAGKNNHLTVSFDGRNLKYDNNTGIITTWTKWEYNGLGPNRAKIIYLRSSYDVRLNTFADIEQISVDSKGATLTSGPAADTAWNNIAPDTLGADLCAALKKHLLSL